MRRPRILFLTHRLPYAPNRGDRIRAYHTLRAFQPFADVHVVSLVHDAGEASHAGEVQSIASSVRTARVSSVQNRVRAVPAMFTSTPLTHVLLHAPEMERHIQNVVAEGRPDLVYAFCSGIADHVLREPLAQIPLIVDMVDVDSGKWDSLAVERPWWHPLKFVYARESHVLGQFEARLARHARATTVINERERALLAQLAPDTNVQAVGNGVDWEGLRPQSPAVADPVVVFCGVMNYEPNEQGMLWFIEQVWPLVLAQRPDARLQVVGANPTERLRAAASAARGVTVTGPVPQVEPFLWQSAVSVAPLFVARGMQNKVIEAIAAGLPVVLTPQVAEGLPPEAMPACVEATRPDDFAREVVQLLALSPDDRRARACQADLTSLSWDRRLRPIVELVQTLTASP